MNIILVKPLNSVEDGLLCEYKFVTKNKNNMYSFNIFMCFFQKINITLKFRFLTSFPFLERDIERQNTEIRFARPTGPALFVEYLLSGNLEGIY